MCIGAVGCLRFRESETHRAMTRSPSQRRFCSVARATSLYVLRFLTRASQASNEFQSINNDDEFINFELKFFEYIRKKMSNFGQLTRHEYIANSSTERVLFVEPISNRSVNMSKSGKSSRVYSLGTKFSLQKNKEKLQVFGRQSGRAAELK